MKDAKEQHPSEGSKEECRPSRGIHEIARAFEEQKGPPGLSGTLDGSAMADWPVDPRGPETLKPKPFTSFSSALIWVKNDTRIGRLAWPKDCFVVLMPALYLPPFNTQDTARKVNDRTAKWIGEDKPLDCQPYFAYYDGVIWQPGWLPDITDLLSEDWEARP